MSSCRTLGKNPDIAYHGWLQLPLVFMPQELLVSPLEWQLWQQMDWTWRPNSLTLSLNWPDTIGFPFLGVHENPGVRDSRGDKTGSCGTNISSSWSHPWCAENLSKSSAWHNQAIHKISQSWWRPYWAPSVGEKKNGVYWQYFNCLLYSFPSFCGPIFLIGCL